MSSKFKQNSPSLSYVPVPRLSRSNIELLRTRWHCVFSSPWFKLHFILRNAITILASKFEGENCNLHRFRLTSFVMFFNIREGDYEASTLYFLLTFSTDVLLRISVFSVAVMTCGAYCPGYEMVWRNADPNRGSRHICPRIIVDIEKKTWEKVRLSIYWSDIR